MSDNKMWDLGEGRTKGYVLVPNDLICLLADSKALKPSESNVLMFLVRHTWGILGKRTVEATAQQIAEFTNLHPQKVSTALRSLEKKGYVTVKREKGGASVYRLNFEPIRQEKTEGKRGRRGKATYDSNSRYGYEEDPAVEAERKRRLDELLGP